MNRPDCYLGDTTRLAGGAGGVVYKIDTTDDQPKVVKIISGSDGVSNPLEIDISFRLWHPCLLKGVNLYIPPNGDTCFDTTQYGISYPLMDESAYTLLYDEPDNPDNPKDLAKRAKFPFSVRLRLFHQVCMGLQALHANGIVHLDVKLGNILVKTDKDQDDQPRYQAILADYGSCVELDDNPSFVSDFLITTRSTRPPENMAGSKRYGYRSDIWSLGITGLELLTGVEITYSTRFYLGLIQAARKINPGLHPSGTWWVSDIISAIWPDRPATQYQLLDAAARFSSKSPWFTEESRRANIHRLLTEADAGEITDDLTDFFMEMLSIGPDKRPDMDWVCQRIGVDPIPTQEVYNQVTEDAYLWANGQVDLLRKNRKAAFLFDLPDKGIAQVTSLVALSLSIVTPVNQDEIMAMIITCFWIVHKARSSLADFDIFMIDVSNLFDWGPDVVEDYDLETPWQRNTEITPATFITMERTIVAGLNGVLLGNAVIV